MTEAKQAIGVGQKHACPSMSRRGFLILGGASITVLATYGSGVEAQDLVSSSYVRKVIGKVSELEPGKATAFNYPTDDVENLLMILNEEAGGGVGDGRNIVAFNTICPHMGGYMGEDEFKSQHSVLGPCPLHLSTFDLTKHGMIVSGHAVESLPQIVLAIEGDDIVATGVMGLFYGYSQNPTGA
ncbi:MAG: Rieske 2Fe-2S domain-containing protein [Paracoccaceae bacterium]